jgi:hypothetical protein
MATDTSRTYGSPDAIIRINLNSPVGNVYALMGAIGDYAKQVRLPKEKVDAMNAEFNRKGATYETICETIGKNIGDIVELYYTPEYSFEIQQHRRESDESDDESDDDESDDE